MPNSILPTIRNLILDMDGVLYRLNTPIRGGAEFLAYLHETGRRFVLVTNNSTLTPGQYADKLSRMGIRVDVRRILTSGEATAMYLSRLSPPGTRVYVVGENGLRTALQKHGFVLADDITVSYVVCGLDRQLTYDKLATATLAIRAGAGFIATNPDRTLPTERGLEPGARAIFSAIQMATDAAPTVIGKPEPAMLELAMTMLNATTPGTAIIGDSLETDIRGGRALGLKTVLLMSGVTSSQQLAHSDQKPDLVYQDISALLADWRASDSIQPLPQGD